MSSWVLAEYFRLPTEKKQRVLRRNVPCYQNCWQTGLLYVSLIGCNPSRLKGKRGWGPYQLTSPSKRKHFLLVVYGRRIKVMCPACVCVCYSGVERALQRWQSTTSAAAATNSPQSACLHWTSAHRHFHSTPGYYMSPADLSALEDLTYFVNFSVSMSDGLLKGCEKNSEFIFVCSTNCASEMKKSCELFAICF